jgi:DNA (cytosine-5)-methyltransferase 1
MMRDAVRRVLSSFKFIDLFAGIGGFHIGLSNAGGECVFVSEWDEAARLTYRHNFEDKSDELFRAGDDRFAGDITAITSSPHLKKLIPKFDVLAAGFPCQPFSQAGLRKGMDETRGTLFFDILKILAAKRPAAFFLENVRGLLSHKSANGTSTMEIIREQLSEAGYYFSEHLVKASDFGVPQHRPRLFIIGFRSKAAMNRFKAPDPVELAISLDEILGGQTDRDIGFTLRVGGRKSGVHDRRNWDTYLVDGVEKSIGPEEGLRLQGFPSWFSFPAEISETQAMKQLGNSVAVPAVRAYAAAIVSALGLPN